MHPDTAGQFINTIKPEQFNERAMALEFVGVYSGSNGDPEMARLNLGRMIRASVLSEMLDNAKAKMGENSWYSGSTD